MASDEDDDLEALRTAALATLKSKEQKPIEKVISSGTFTRPKGSSTWQDLPDGIHCSEFSDPIPEAGHPPPLHPGTRPQAGRDVRQPFLPFSQHLPHQNGMPPMPQRFRHGSRQQRRNFPRFPYNSFGHRQERGNGRYHRHFLQQPQRGGGNPGLYAGGPHSHLSAIPTQDSAGGAGANLIVIQPQALSQDRLVPPPSSHTVPGRPTNSASANVENSENKKLSLPQDKYHTTPGISKAEDTNSQQEVKSKDKFSRYDKSDSEDEDLSDVDDIANEIDRVLQDEVLGEETGESHRTETPTQKEEETQEDTPAEPLEPVSSPDLEEELDEVASASEESDTGSLDLDALANGEPVLGDLEDLDSLVDKEPEVNCDDTVMSSKDSEGSSRGNNREVRTPQLASPADKADEISIENDVLNIDVEDDSFIVNNENENTTADKCVHKVSDRPPPRKQSPSKRLSPSPLPSRSSPRGRGSFSPRRSDNYYTPISPARRSRSPVYSRRRGSISPRRPALSSLRRSRSPRRNSPPRRSMSPRRRLPESTLDRRRYMSPLRNPLHERRRGNSPRRRSYSPGGRIRPRDRDGERMDNRDYSRGPNRLHRDRYAFQDHNRRDRQLHSNNHSSPQEKPVKEDGLKPDALQSKQSPKERRSPAEEEQEPVVDLDKLTPEERAKIEARRKKFGTKAEVNLTEGTKTISLKNIKTREKKQKKKEKLEVEAREKEALPDANKKQPTGISLKKLRKKQESRKVNANENVEQDSPPSVRVADIEDDSEDSDGGRAWKKEQTTHVAAARVKLPPSRLSQRPRPLLAGRDRERDDARSKRHGRPRPEKAAVKDRWRSAPAQSTWSSDEDDGSNVVAHGLSSTIIPSQPFEPDLPPEKLRVQVQIVSKKSKKKSKAHPDFSNVYSVHAKQQHEAAEKAVEEMEEVPAKKVKKKKDKKKKHSSKDSDEDASRKAKDDGSPASAKPSILERLGRKLDLTKPADKKEKKKSKKNRSTDEGTSDLDLHILKIKEKNQRILQRQQEIQKDKERYA